MAIQFYLKTKICCDCFLEKNINNFEFKRFRCGKIRGYIRKRCHDCQSKKLSINSRLWAKKNKNHVNIKSRLWRSNPENMFKARIAHKNWSKTEYGKECIKINAKKFRDSRPEIGIGHYAVQKALKSGLLIKPRICSNCFSENNIQAHHHKGYDDKFLTDVIWVCAKCHKHEHMETLK